MTRLSIVVRVLVIGIVVRCASALDTPRLPEDGRRASPRRTLKPVPLSEAERLQFAHDSRTRAGGGAGEVVYEFLEFGGGHLPQFDQWGSEQLPAEDMILVPGKARELVGYMAQVHQPASDGTLGFTAKVSLYTDDGTGAYSLPNAGIDGTSCSIPNLHGLGRPDEGIAMCVPNPPGDSGIILGDKVWLAVNYEGGCRLDPHNEKCNESAGLRGPGWLLGPSGGLPSVGSTEPIFAITNGEIWALVGLAGENGLLCSASAGVPAPVPTVSEWGMAVIVLLVLTGGTIVLRRPRSKSTA